MGLIWQPRIEHPPGLPPEMVQPRTRQEAPGLDLEIRLLTTVDPVTVTSSNWLPTHVTPVRVAPLKLLDEQVVPIMLLALS